MAKDSVIMTNFHTAAPVCTPTRASIITGLFPWRLGIYSIYGSGPQVIKHPYNSPTSSDKHFDTTYSSYRFPTKFDDRCYTLSVENTDNAIWIHFRILGERAPGSGSEFPHDISWGRISHWYARDNPIVNRQKWSTYKTVWILLRSSCCSCDSMCWCDIITIMSLAHIGKWHLGGLTPKHTEARRKAMQEQATGSGSGSCAAIDPGIYLWKEWYALWRKELSESVESWA
jgi:hypothetical protein